MNDSGNGCGIERIIKATHNAYGAARSLEEFVIVAGQLLMEAEISTAQVRSFLHDQWDPGSCLPHLVDTDLPPFLIDLHTNNDWCLRATIWPAEDETDWRDVPHSHFGFIATTPITDVAYRVRVYPSFEQMDDDITAEPFRRGDLHLIRPPTIHEVVLPEGSFGISLSLRTRAVREISEEWNRAERRIETRTKSALDRKRAVLKYLETGSWRSV